MQFKSMFSQNIVQRFHKTKTVWYRQQFCTAVGARSCPSEKSETTFFCCSIAWRNSSVDPVLGDLDESVHQDQITTNSLTANSLSGLPRGAAKDAKNAVLK
jgi:hypothetical protein